MKSDSQRIFAAAFILCLSLTVKAEELKIWISTSVEQNIMSKLREPFEKTTGIKLVSGGDIKQASGPIYYRDVLSGKVEASTNSQTYDEWVNDAKKHAGVTDEEAAQITHRTIGHDLMQVVCHKDVGVDKLSIVQLRLLFSGERKNWKEVGGADQEFNIIFPFKIKVTTASAFKRLVLKDKDYGAPMTEAAGYDDMVQKIGKTKGACGFGPSGTPLHDAVAINTPPIGRPSVLITKGKPNEKVQKLIEFIRAEGPKYGVK